MEMILVDWTRMGKVYCLAGAVADGKGWRFMRPLLAKDRDSPVRNTGWSPYLLDGWHFPVLLQSPLSHDGGHG